VQTRLLHHAAAAAVCCRANKRIISFSCLLCMMALFNALFIPLHLEDRILQHPDTAMMHVAGRLPDWQDADALQDVQRGLQNGSMELNESFVMQRMQQAAAASVSNSSSTVGSHAAAATTKQLPTAAAGPGALSAGREGAVEAVGRLAQRVQLYRGEALRCPDVERLRRNLLKHHEEIFRMQVGAHQLVGSWQLEAVYPKAAQTGYQKLAVLKMGPLPYSL
jgi:hypothetical protein